MSSLEKNTCRVLSGSAMSSSKSREANSTEEVFASPKMSESRPPSPAPNRQSAMGSPPSTNSSEST